MNMTQEERRDNDGRRKKGNVRRKREDVRVMDYFIILVILIASAMV